MNQIQNPEEKEGKSELLKREEIKTMEKDVARLREIESKSESEKISAIKAEPVAAKPVEEPKPAASPQPEINIPEPEKTPLESLMPKAPVKKKSAFKKILVRAGLLLFIASIVGLFLYFNFRKNPENETVVPTPQENQVSPGNTSQEITFPESVISTDQTKLIEIAEEDPALILSQVLGQKMAEASLTRILIKNSVKDLYLPARESILASFGFSLPDEIMEKLESSYTLAVNGQKEGNRLTFTAKTNNKQGLIDSLKKWEKSTSTSFKTASLQNTLFRYISLGKNDLGICYLVLGDYFVLTNSFQGMEKIIKELNFEKSLGQLLMVGLEGKSLTPEFEAFFKKYKPGSLLLLQKNIENKEQLKTLTSQLQSLSLKETGLPLLIATDQEGGPINRVEFLGEKTAQKNIENESQALQVGKARGKELKEIGINFNLAPVLDWTVSGDFLFERSFQKPIEATGELAKSLISGQKSEGVASAMKHFPGYSGINFNPENTLAELEAVPEINQFKKALEANPEFVMTSNVVYKEVDSLPFSLSAKAIDFLKNNLGENILVMSDDLAQDSLIKNYSLREIMAKPIEAGVDMLIFSGYKVPVEQGLDEFLKAYKNNQISKAKAERAISRITRLKQNLLK